MAFELTKQDCELLQQDLTDFLSLSEASSALLCDKGGSVMFQEGTNLDSSIDLICALVAGSFAATKELAKALGEDEFSAIFHQGNTQSIFISSVDEEVLLLAIFSEDTNAGLVKMHAQSTSRKMQSLLKEISQRESVQASDETVSFVIKEGSAF